MTTTGDVVERTAAALGWTESVTAEVDWDTVERRLGTPFPGDFKAFMARFPSGMFRGAVRLFNPVQNEKSFDRFTEQFDQFVEIVGLMYEHEYDTYVPFPRPGGLVPFASDSAGGSLLWVPWTPEVDKWHVVHLSRNVIKGYTRTKRSMTSVMLELATTRSERNVLGWDLAGAERTFEPFA